MSEMRPASARRPKRQPLLAVPADRGSRRLAQLTAALSLAAAALILLVVIGFAFAALRASATDDGGLSSALFRLGPLLVGTLWVTGIALVTALPLALLSAVYLTEYTDKRRHKRIHRVLATVARTPTIVMAVFGLLVVVPGLRQLGCGVSGFSAAAAGLVLGLLLLPYAITLYADTLVAVSNRVRRGALALGSGRMAMWRSVVLTTARPGLLGASILVASRGVGEALIAALLAGQSLGPTAHACAPTTTLASGLLVRAMPHHTGGATSGAWVEMGLLAVVATGLSVWGRRRMRANIAGVR